MKVLKIEEETATDLLRLLKPVELIKSYDNGQRGELRDEYPADSPRLYTQGEDTVMFIAPV